MSARQEILNAALRHMAARGADAASLRSIAEDVGIRKPSIMYHFASKDALRQAVLEELLGRWNDVIPRLILATTQDGVGRFEALTRELIDFFSEDPDRARLLFRELMDRPDEMQNYLQSYVRPWINVIAQQINSGIPIRDVNPEIDAEAFVWVMVNSVIGTIALSSRLGETALSDDRVKNANARLTTELVRMARSSLFHPQHLVDTLSDTVEHSNAKLL